MFTVLILLIFGIFKIKGLYFQREMIFLKLMEDQNCEWKINKPKMHLKRDMNIN